MVRGAAAAQAAELARERPRLSVGLHLDFGEWAYRDGEWPAVYEVVALDDPEGIEREARAQLDAFRALLGRDPTHLDSHQHLHRREAAPAARRLAAELGVPLREEPGAPRYCGAFYGRDATGAPTHEFISVENLVAILRDLPEGASELACHPGTAGCDDPSYGVERAMELEALTDPRVRAAIEQERIALNGR
jgi:predicted glycoside hydrolase/deacetylase ChbG (UPF0249 family)